MHLTIINRKDEKFEYYWQYFLNNNLKVSWQYLLHWLDFEKLYSEDHFIDDLSFILLLDNKPVCICPLYLEIFDEQNVFSWKDNGGYLPAPISKNNIAQKLRKKIDRQCFTLIDELAQENNVAKTMFMVDPLSEIFSFNRLVQYGYTDSSSNTNILSLDTNKENIWAGLRKSYKSLINNGKEYYNIELFDHKNQNPEAHNIYREFHHKASGRITRENKTWGIQYEMLKNDNAVLIGIKDKSRFVAFSYFFHLNNNAYYASSSDDPEYQNSIPLEHCIIWKAIEYYSQRGFNSLEMGRQLYSRQLFDHPSQKDLSISFFKSGFGGEVFSLFRGIKYYDNKLMKKELEYHVSKLLEETSIVQ